MSGNEKELTYIENLFDSAINGCIVLVRRLIKLSRTVTDHVSKHATLAHCLVCHLSRVLEVTATARSDFRVSNNQFFCNVTPHGNINLGEDLRFVHGDHTTLVRHHKRLQTN